MKVASQRLMEMAEAVLVALGASPEEGALVARSLVWADMRGIPTHGMNFLTKIVDRIEKGVLDLPTRGDHHFRRAEPRRTSMGETAWGRLRLIKRCE